MDIIPIFEAEIPPLCAIKYIGEDVDEFERLFDLWNDISYLKDFFEKNIEFLNNGFLGNITVKEAIEETIKDAEAFQEYLLDIGEGNIEGVTFDDIFEELNGGIAVELSSTKAKGYNPNRKASWLRLYAIKIGSNVYIVTGGAIKLTGRMSQAPDTKKELPKFDKCLEFLKEQNILEPDALHDYLEEKHL